MTANVGLSVLEGVANGVSPFVEVSKHTIGLLMERERGIPNKVTRITSLQEDRQMFGGVTADSYGALVVRNIYKNAGRFGAVIYGARIIGETSVAATFTIVEGVDDVLVVTAGQKGFSDPGIWGNNVKVKLYPAGSVGGDVDNLAIDISYKGNLKERFLAATHAELIAVVNANSNYVILAAGAVTAFTGIKEATLAGGTYVAPVDADFEPVTSDSDPKGLALLDGVDVQLVINSEIHTSAMALAGRDYCANRGDCMYIANLPLNSGETEVTAFATALQNSGPSYIACYLNWAKTSNESGFSVDVPIIGAVLGAGYIKVPGLNQDLIFTPPAGIDASLSDISEISNDKLSQATINFYVQSRTVNVVVFKSGYGFFPISSRTMATDPKYHSIHIRRQTNYYLKMIDQNLLFAAQKPNLPTLKREMYVALYTYFRNEYNLGGLENEVGLDTALQIITDKSINPVGQDRKLINVEIQWIPTEVTEAIVIRINRNDGILLVNEVQS